MGIYLGETNLLVTPQQPVDVQAIFDIVHPVGDIYVQYTADSNPNTLFNNSTITSTWTDVTPENMAPWFDTTDNAGTTLDGSLPCITGVIYAPRPNDGTYLFKTASGCFDTQASSLYTYTTLGVSTATSTASGIYFSAHASNDIYRTSSDPAAKKLTRPTSTVAKMWKRTA